MVDFFNNIVTVLQTWIGPLAIIALTVCGLSSVFATDPQSKQKFKSWFFSILIGLLLIYLAPEIVRIAKVIAGKIKLDDLAN